MWLLWGFVDLAQPVYRVKDEPRPTCAIVHACSRVASRNGAAGYKLMRSSHATWTLTLDPQTTSPEANREEVEKLDNRAFFRPAIIQSAAVLEAVKARPGDVEVCLYGRATADLDSFCARRRPKSAVGAEESLRRGRTKESAKARKKGLDGAPAHIIPIALAASQCPTSRDFVHWRFSDAGHRSAWIASSCRRPKTYTEADDGHGDRIMVLSRDRRYIILGALSICRATFRISRRSDI